MFDVLLPFSVPVFCVLSRSCISAIVSMPKASINENRYVLVKKNKVRMPFNIIVPSPSGNMLLVKILDKFSSVLLFPKDLTRCMIFDRSDFENTSAINHHALFRRAFLNNHLQVLIIPIAVDLFINNKRNGLLNNI